MFAFLFKAAVNNVERENASSPSWKYQGSAILAGWQGNSPLHLLQRVRGFQANWSQTVSKCPAPGVKRYFCPSVTILRAQRLYSALTSLLLVPEKKNRKEEHIVLFSKCNAVAILRGSNDSTDGINEYKICVKSSAFMQVSSRIGMVISVPSWDLNLFVWYSLPWRWRGGVKSSTYSLWEQSVIRQTQRVSSDSPHILHSGYDLLPSGRCWRVKNSSVPTSIKIWDNMLLKAVQAVQWRHGALSFLYAVSIQVMCMWLMCFRCDLLHFVYTWQLLDPVYLMIFNIWAAKCVSTGVKDKLPRGNNKVFRICTVLW